MFFSVAFLKDRELFKVHIKKSHLVFLDRLVFLNDIVVNILTTNLKIGLTQDFNKSNLGFDWHCSLTNWLIKND